MKSRSMFLTLALVAAFTVAGCGEDNGRDNDNDGGGPTATTTPQVTATVPPATATPTPTTPPVTPTGDTPTPVPTGTPVGGGCEGSALSLTLTTIAGSDLDTGFSGIAFNQGSLVDTTVTVDLNCTGSDCQIDGTALVGTQLGSPLPLTAGGVSTCVINTFREAVTGTYNCTTGCSESAVRITSQVFQKSNPVQPCPVCTGDGTPNDGVKGGTCSSDATTPGVPCDVNGVSETGLGSTSKDCLPTGSDIGALAIDLVPFTTGTASLPANVQCEDGQAGCYCPGQITLNQCRAGDCLATGPGEVGQCAQGPTVGGCDGVEFQLKCDPGAGTRDCEQRIPGSGTCVGALQNCIAKGATITRTGQCAPPGESGIAVATFCIPETRTPAINTVVGLPGPGAATLPGMTVRVVR
jgi:hypothetical protein